MRVSLSLATAAWLLGAGVRGLSGGPLPFQKPPQLETFLGKLQSLAPPTGLFPTLSVGPTDDTAGAKAAALFGAPDGINADAIIDMCADDVLYDDLASGPVSGKTAVANLLKSKFPPSARLVVERTAYGNATTGGFTWRRQAVGDDDTKKSGLRGITYVRFDAKSGKLAYAREASEPILKAGELLETLLRAATKDAAPKDEAALKKYTPRVPTSASDLVQYLWAEAYPNGAPPAVALELFSDDIVYEDLNYPEPFVGKPAVQAFVEAFDIPGVAFVPEEISGGGSKSASCCFAWKITVNGQDGPAGCSFYEVDPATTLVTYIRDCPATKPAPLQQLAALRDPVLRVF